MARPKKHNADYFSHDADMRNDPRVKAVRRKFSHIGYAVWNMLLEVITDSDFFTVEWSEIDIEILAGDFDVTPDQLSEIVDYCVKLGLLQIEIHPDKKGNSILTCEKLKERFSELLNKRERNAKKTVPAAETPPKAEFQPQKLPTNEVSDVQNPQSKVKYSKVKYSKVNLSTKEKEEEGVGRVDGGDAASPSPSPLDETVEVVLGDDGEPMVSEPVANPTTDPAPTPAATTPHCGAPPPKQPTERAKAVVDYFNAQCVTLPKVQQLTSSRKITINTRLVEKNGTENLKTVIDKTAASNFLNGRNDRKWKANFDWILKPTNYTKILEGTYDNDDTNINQSTTGVTATSSNGYSSAEANKRASRAELENFATAILSGATSP